MTNETETVHEETPAAPPEPQETGVSAEVKAVVEALIFASPEPITPKMLFKLLSEEPKEDVCPEVVLEEIQTAEADPEKDRPPRGAWGRIRRPGGREWCRR